MEDVVRRSFASPLAMAAMEAALIAAGGLDWQPRETREDGLYLRGVSRNGVKIRILARGPRFVAEIWFPVGAGWTRFSENEKVEFVAWVSSHVLAALGAADERDETGSS